MNEYSFINAANIPHLKLKTNFYFILFTYSCIKLYKIWRRRFYLVNLQ